MVGRKGLGALSWVIVAVVVLAVVYVGWNYYNVSGAGITVASAVCVANPELSGWADVEFASLGVANYEALNTKCGKLLVSIECNGQDISGSSLKACVWDTNVDCGDGVIDTTKGEQCEGTNLNGKTCADYGKANGILVCRNDCKIDQSRCY